MSRSGGWELGEAAETLSRAWALTMANLGVLLGAELLVVLPTFVVYALFHGVGVGLWLRLGEGPTGPMLGATLIAAGALTAVLVGAQLALGYVQVLLRIARGETAGLADLLASPGAAGLSLAAAAIAQALVVVAGLTVLVAPGVVAAAALFWTPLLIADRGLSAPAAMAESLRMFRRRWREMLVWVVLVLSINLIGVAVCAVGQMLTAPLTALASILVYDRLAGPRE